EALSDGWAVRVRAASAKLFAGGEVVGKTASLRISFEDEGARLFTGVVARCALQKDHTGGNLLEGEIRSRLWLLGLGRDSRLFTEVTIKDVVQEVLEKAGIPAADQEWNLDKETPARPHIIQREESDLAFVQRLLARDGIGYAIHNGE